MLAEVEGAELGKATTVVVMSGVVCRGFYSGVQAMSSSGRSSVCCSRKCNSLSLWVSPYVNSFLYQ